MSIENPRETFDKNETDIAQTKQAIAEAAVAGEYDKVATLAQEAKNIEAAKSEMIGNAYDEASSENAMRDREKMDALHEQALEDNRKIDEAKAAEEKANREAALAEQAKLDAENSQKEAAALLEKLKSGGAGSPTAEVAGKVEVADNPEVPVEAEAAQENSVEELAKQYLWNGKPGYISGKLELTPESIRTNREFMIEAIDGSKDPGNVMNYAGENLRNDKEFALYAMSVNGLNSHSDSVYEKLSPELQNDRDVVIAAVRDAHTSFDKIPSQFKDKEMTLLLLNCY